MTAPARVFVKPRRARPFWFGHPWVFSGAIERVKGSVEDGEVVEVCDAEGKTIGRGFFNGRSQIRVRMLSLAGEDARPVPELIRARVHRALDLRLEQLRLPEETNAFRCVHSDGDGLPGLIVDHLDGHLIVQLSSLGMARHLDVVSEVLRERLSPKSLLERASALQEEEGMERPEGVLDGTPPDGPLEVREGGLRWFCDPVGGQKTGWYSDQRTNRAHLAPLAQGREVLDAFSYVGGFGMRMAAAGARAVTCLDSSESALGFAAKAAEANGFSEVVQTEKGNVLRVLEHWAKEQRRFDLVVLDPPKLVFKRKDLERGLRLYLEVNLKGLAVLRDGGILVTCSCSQHVTEALFEEMITEAAHHGGVRLQEIWRGGQGEDHPAIVPLEESRYLSCRAYRVLGEARPQNYKPFFRPSGADPRRGGRGSE